MRNLTTAPNQFEYSEARVTMSSQHLVEPQAWPEVRRLRNENRELKDFAAGAAAIAIVFIILFFACLPFVVKQLTN